MPSKLSRAMAGLCAMGLLLGLVPAVSGMTAQVCMISRRGKAKEDLAACRNKFAGFKYEFDVYEMCHGHSFWNAGYHWDDPDDCFDLCGPCIERAMALGADAAVCNRRTGRDFCSHGYAPRTLQELHSVECVDDPNIPHRFCQQYPADMRADLLRVDRQPSRTGPWDAVELFPEDELEELRDFRENNGMAEMRWPGVWCATPMSKPDCNTGHDRDGTGRDVLWGWDGPSLYSPELGWESGTGKIYTDQSGDVVS